MDRWTIGWSIYTHRRSTVPSLEVRGVYGMPVYDLPDGRRDLGDQALDVTVLNDGAVRLTVTSVYYELEGRPETLPVINWLLQDPRPLPIVLEPGEQWHGMIPLEPMRDAVVEHYGRPLRVRASAAAGAVASQRLLGRTCRRAGVTADRLRMAIGRACRDGAVPHFSPHDLRHRRISLLHQAGPLLGGDR